MTTHQPDAYVTSTGHRFTRSSSGVPRWIGTVVLTAADGQSQTRKYCAHRHRSSTAADTCARSLALGIAPKAQVCRDCQTLLPGYMRASARRRGWEPWSYHGQDAIDHGPMVCPDCVAAAIDRVAALLHSVGTGSWV